MEGIQCRIKSLGLFKGTVPLLRHILSRISSLRLFEGTIPLLRLYCRILSFCDSTMPSPDVCFCLEPLVAHLSFGGVCSRCRFDMSGRLVKFVLLESCCFEYWRRVEGVVSSTRAHTLTPLKQKKNCTYCLSSCRDKEGFYRFIPSPLIPDKRYLWDTLTLSINCSSLLNKQVNDVLYESC